MDGKKATTPQPGDFSNDRFERGLAEGREAIRQAEAVRASLRLPPAELTEEQNRDGEFLTQFDKDLEERRIQSREFRAKLHKVSMGVLSRLETEATDAVKERHRDKPRKSVKNKYAQFWKKGFEGLHPSQMQKTEKYLVKADLTIAERDCYYLRVGYSKKFAEIASRMGYTHHSTAQEHFEKAKLKINSRHSLITRKDPQR